jgi:hypothetical protein
MRDNLSAASFLAWLALYTVIGKWRARLAELFRNPDPSPSPSDVIYDDMTRAWRNEDYPLAQSLADVLLGYLSGPDSGQPLTGGRDPYYVLRIYAYYYAPLPDATDAPDFCTAGDCQIRHHAPHS